MDGEQRRAIARSVAILVAAVVIISVIVWAVFFRGNEGQKNTNGKSPTASEQSDKKAGNTNIQKAEQKTGETKPTGQAAGPNATSQNQPPQQLANVGPGNMTSLFTVAATSGTVFHFALRRYRRNRNK